MTYKSDAIADGASHGWSMDTADVVGGFVQDVVGSLHFTAGGGASLVSGVHNEAVSNPGQSRATSDWFTPTTSNWSFDFFLKSGATDVGGIVESFGQLEIIGLSSGTGGQNDLRLYVNGSPITFTGVILTDNAWHHYAVTNASGAGNMKAYRDGVEIGSVTGVSITSGATNTMRLGLSGGGFGGINGVVDEIYLYPLTLAPATVATHAATFTPSTYPVNTTFSAELTPWTSFPSFVSFGTQPLALTQSEPTNTLIRYAFKFSAGDSARTWDGSAWSVLSGEPTTNGMTEAQVEALTAANMVATNGFVSGSPYLKMIAYLRTSDANVTPSLDQVTMTWKQGAAAPISWAATYSSDVPVDGGSDLPAGTYIWTTGDGYRIEDGNTDDGNAITKTFTTQEVTSGDNQSSVLREIEVEIAADSAGSLTVTPLTDGNEGTSKTVTAATGTDVYYVGVTQPSSSSGQTHRGWGHQAKLSWIGNAFTVNSVAFVIEVSGRTRP